MWRHGDFGGIVADGGYRRPHMCIVTDMVSSLRNSSSYNINSRCKALISKWEYTPIIKVTYLSHNMTWFHPNWAVEHCEMKPSGPLYLIGSIFDWRWFLVLIVGLWMLTILSICMVFFDSFNRVGLVHACWRADVKINDPTYHSPLNG